MNDLKKMVVQLGNTGDSDGAVLAEGLVLGTLESLTSYGSTTVYVGVVIRKKCFVAETQLLEELNPDMSCLAFSAADTGMAGYCTRAVGWESFPLRGSMPFDAEETICKNFKVIDTKKRYAHS